VLLLSTGMFALMSAPTGDAPPTKEPDDSIGALALINVPVVEPKAPNPPPLLEAMGAFTLINDPTTEPPSATVPDDSTGALTLTNVPEPGRSRRLPHRYSRQWVR